MSGDVPGNESVAAREALARGMPVTQPAMPLVLLPPAARSRAALGLTAAAAIGRFELQSCLVCGAVQYPPREACHRCLSVELEWREQSDRGELLARTTLHHSNEPFFRQRLPWAIGLIRLDCGPSVVAHLHGSVRSAGSPVRVALCLNRSGSAVVVAFSGEEEIDVANDKQLSELSCDPKARKVLVTDARSETGAALIHALVAAGAGTVWAGSAGEVVSFPAFDNVVPLALDVTNDTSVAEAAALIGADVDILINTAERRLRADDSPGRETADFRSHVGAGAPTPRDSEAAALGDARADMETHYFGLMRLAREFGPRMRARNAAGQGNAVAWVNLISIHALAGSPTQDGFAAAEAAAHSLSLSLRAQMLPAGIRVMNVFTGPIEHGAAGLADEIVTALRRGTEDVYAGDFAQHVFARWRANPKGLERELAAAAVD